MRVVVRNQPLYSRACLCTLLNAWSQPNIMMSAALREEWDEVEERLPLFVHYLKDVDRACGTNVSQYEKVLNAAVKARKYLFFTEVIYSIEQNICGHRHETPEELERKAAEHM